MQELMEYLNLVIDDIDETLLSTSTAFDNDEPEESINNDLNSLKEALDKHEKIFLAIGDFGYDDYDEEPYFIFGGDDILETSEFDDEYYDKYKFSLAGYGIYLDKDLNVEYGYFTIEAPPSGHGMGYTTFHDFKDAKDGDIIKEKIYSELHYYNTEETDYKPSIDLNKYNPKNNPINLKLQELSNPIRNFVEDDHSFDIEQKKVILNALIESIHRISKSTYLVEETPEVIIGECPHCGKEVSKETKNQVIIKCSQCENTFLF